MVILGEVKKLREELGDLYVDFMLLSEWTVVNFEPNSPTLHRFYTTLPVQRHIAVCRETTYTPAFNIIINIHSGIIGRLEPSIDVDICRELINLSR